MRRRLRPLVERVPPRAWAIIGVLVLFLGGFGITVGPLLFGGNLVRAEVTGIIPGRATAGQTLAIELSLDNTGDVGLSPLCVLASADGGVELRSVRFQGIDTEPFDAGRACGGRLNAQETVSLTVTLLTPRPGMIHLSFTAAQGAKAVGPALSGTVAVSP